MRGLRRQGKVDLRGYAGHEPSLGIGYLELDPEGTGGLVGLRRDVAHPPLHRLTRDQAGLAGSVRLDVVALLLGDVSGHQYGVFLENPSRWGSRR